MKRYTSQDGDLFQGIRFSDVRDQNTSKIESEINAETEDYIFNVNENAYIDSIESRYLIELPIMNFDNPAIDKYEAEIPVEYLPKYMRSDSRNGYFTHEIYQLFIPIDGNTEVLKYRLNTITSSCWGEFRIDYDHLVMDYLTFSTNADEIKRHFETAIDGLKGMCEYLKTEVTNYNDNLRKIIKQKFEARKSHLLSKKNLLASIGFPLRERTGISKTFSIPAPKLRESIRVAKPVVSDKGYQAEPAIDDQSYSKILKYINDIGRNFERMPSVYSGKQEEDLRDHILFVLDPHFENGSASGETFNKTGKTDIQIRYDSSVVFIAECKFWTGTKGYIETINQLLGYLTWRNTKTSIIMFVKQKDISLVVEKIKTTTPTHPNYMGFIGQSDDNWFNYRFHINGDSNREIKLAVQIFHIP